MATLWGVGALSAIGSEEGGLGLGAALIGGLHIASAVSGNRAADRCKSARVEHDEWLQAQTLGDEPRKKRAGSRSGHCYDDGSCDGALRCHRASNICVLDDRVLDPKVAGRTPPPEPKTPPPPKPRPRETAAKTPAVAPPAPARKRRPKPDYAEFWREVSP